MNPNLGDVVQWVQTGGAVAVLVVVMIAFIRGWIVPASTYSEAKARYERAEQTIEIMRSVSTKNTDNAELMVNILERIMPLLTGKTP